MPITKASKINDVVVLRTGTFLDTMTGIGGLPRGRLVEFWGDQDTGKSSACIQTIVAAQKEGLRCLWVDVEWTFSGEYATKLGVDMNKLDVLREKIAEDIIDQTEKAMEEGDYDVIVFDSIGDLSSRAQKEKQAGEKTIGVQASLMTRFAVNIAPLAVMNKILFIGVNHSRTDIMSGKLFQMGGKKWSEKKKLSIRFRENTNKQVKRGEIIIGKVMIAKVTKNHVGDTYGLEQDAVLLNGEGFSVSANLLEVALSANVFEKAGNTYSFQKEKIGTLSKLRDWMKVSENETRVNLVLAFKNDGPRTLPDMR